MRIAHGKPLMQKKNNNMLENLVQQQTYAPTQCEYGVGNKQKVV